MIFLRVYSMQSANLKKVMISGKELADLLTIREYRANKIIRLINDELKAEGYYVLETRPPQAPFERVKHHLKKMGINLKEN